MGLGEGFGLDRWRKGGQYPFRLQLGREKGDMMVRKLVQRLAFVLVLLTPFSVQASGNYIPYSPQAVKTALGQGCAVLLDFTAKW